jgi:hypothetical protein
MWKLGLRPRNSQKRNTVHNWDFICSAWSMKLYQYAYKIDKSPNLGTNLLDRNVIEKIETFYIAISKILDFYSGSTSTSVYTYLLLKAAYSWADIKI